ncbi:MAG: hypothetical protein H0W57_06065 [Rubrobacteraceae bacterium]|nr:hypothetical protein [Rubrobacter sp.]MBA3635969.1 hypothetical protein [Rubrobacteraceae bacterium]
MSGLKAAAGLIAVVLLVILVVALTALFPPRGCDGVDAEQLTAGEVDQLVARGWWGSPHDSEERLYPCSCFEEKHATPKQYDGTLTPGSGV